MSQDFFTRKSKKTSKPKKAPHRIVDSLEIIDLSNEGQGVGRTEDGLVLFVPETVPGDIVSVEVTKAKKRHGFGRVKEFLTQSPDRVEPQCEYYGRCGGCSWQHISAEAQVHWKGRILQQVLERVGQIELPEPPTVRSSSERYGTRTRLRLQVGSKQSIGLYQRGTKKIVRIKNCPVATPLLNDVWNRLSENLSVLTIPLNEVRLLGGTDGKVVASFHMNRNTKLSTPKARKTFDQWWRSKQEALGPLCGIELMQAQDVLMEVGHTILEVGEPHTMYRPSGFAQASWEGNDLLVEEVVSVWKRKKTRNVLELYCGCGNLSLALAKEGAYVWGLDSNGQAIRDARVSARAHQLQQQVQFETFDDHHNSLHVYCEAHETKFDTLLIDPPRRGLASRIRDEIIETKFPQVIYVSCDPGTLARDLRVFLDNGYRLDHVSAVDLMPQTAHIESVALLTLDESIGS